MSYKITSPLTLTNNGEVDLILSNTSSNNPWTIKLDTGGNLTMGSTSSPSILSMNGTTGQVTTSGSQKTSSGIIFQKSSGALTVDASPTTDTYSLTYPSSSPTTNQVMVYSGSSSQWKDLYTSVPNLIEVSLTPNPLQYSTIASAISSIPSSGGGAPSSTNRYVIYVYPGVYTENALVLPSYVSLIGEGSVIIQPVIGGYDLLTLSLQSGVSSVTLQNVSSPNYALSFPDVGNYALASQIQILNCSRGVRCNSQTRSSYIYLEEIMVTSTLSSLNITDNNSGFLCMVSARSYVGKGPSATSVVVNGSQSFLLMEGSSLQEGDGTGVGITLSGGGRASLSGLYIERMGTAITTTNDSGSPALEISATQFSNCTTNLNIANPRTTGYFAGYSPYSQTVIDSTSSFFVVGKEANIITVERRGGDFSSVAAAMASITDASSSNTYVISVGSGTFVEPSIVMKPYVNIIGVSSNVSLIVASDPSSSLVVGAPYSILRNVSLTTTESSGTPTSGGRLIDFHGDASGGLFTVDSVVLGNGETLINVDSTNGYANIFLFIIHVLTNANFVHGVKVADGPSHDGVAFLSSNFSWAPTSCPHFLDFISISSSSSTLNIEGEITDLAMGYLPLTGSGMVLEGPVKMILSNTVISNMGVGVSLPNTSVNAPNILINSTVFYGNTQDINIANPGTAGTINIIGDVSKVSVDPSSTVSLLVNGLTGDILVTGTIRQGSTVSQNTDISTQIQQGSTLGSIVTPSISLSGLNVTVQGGRGYLMVGATVGSDYLKYVIWTTQTITLPASTASWIFVDSTGTLLSSPAMPSYITNIILGRAKMGSASVEFFQNIAFRANHAGNRVINANRQSLGNIFNSGCLGTPGSTGLKVSVSSGDYWYGGDNYLPTSTTDITMTGYYRNGLGGYVSQSLTEIPLFYDDGSGTLQALGVGDWAKHSIYIVGDGSTQKYLFVYGQSIFTSQIEAQTGSLPLPPSFFDGNIAPIIGMIVNGADVTLTNDRFQDIRPTLAFKASSSTVTSDHNSLLNLTVGDAHPQYFRTDGTRVMTGDIQAGGNQVTGVSALSLLDASTNTITLKTPTLSSSYTLTFPTSGGALNQILSALGGGATQWISTSSLGTSVSTPSTLVLRDSSGKTHLISLYIDDGTGRNVELKVPTLSSSYALTLPSAAGAASQIPITTDTSGGLGWVSASSSNTSSALVQRDGSGNFTAGTITATLSGNATTSTSFTGSLSGDVTGTQSSTVVASVGGSSASSVHSAELLANAATNLNTPSTIVKRDASGNFTAGTITATLSGNATTSTSFTGSLNGDVTGTQSSTVVASVGGSSASSVHSAELLANAATNLNTPSAIVKRDASGNFTAGTITATLSGNATTSTSFTGSLVGDVTGTQGATVVSTVGGSSASSVHSAELLANAATNLNTSNTLVKRDAFGNFTAGTITATLNGNASNFTGSLSGDVTGGQASTVVATVGGSSASSVHSAELLANASTSSNTPSTIVKRDASGNFTAGTITATLSGAATSATSFTGNLVGDVTGTQGATVVSTVGGSSASSVHSAELLANAATNLNTPSTIVKRDGSGNFTAGTITATLSGTATNFSGSLVGDVTGTQGATVVSTVGGSSASAVHTGELLANAATDLNTPSTIVKRDASGNFTAGTITATLNGNASSASSVSGTIGVANGGTGLTSLTTGRVLVGNGTALDLTRSAPTGAFVGDTDAQTLTNKTITGTTNNVDANSLRNGSTWVVSMGGSAPSAGASLVATSSTAAQWSSNTETVDYIPFPIYYTGTTTGGIALGSTLSGGIFRITQRVTFSKLLFKIVSGGTSGTILVAIYQTSTGVSGNMSLVCSGSVSPTSGNIVYTISYGSTFTLVPGICTVLIAQTSGTGIVVETYTVNSSALLTAFIPAGSYPTQFGTSLTPPQSTFNPATQSTVSNSSIVPIVRLLA